MTRRGDCDGLLLAAAGETVVFEDLLESDPNAKVFAYAIPITVGERTEVGAGVGFVHCIFDGVVIGLDKGARREVEERGGRACDCTGGGRGRCGG